MVDRVAVGSADQHDGVGIFVWAFHAGGAHGHAGNREPAGLWLFAEQLLNIGDWDVTFEGVAINESGVARAIFLRDAGGLTGRGGAGNFFDGDAEAGGADEFHPLGAAATSGCLEDSHLRRRRGGK